MKVNKYDKIEEISVYDIKDFRIGHAQDKEAQTGCTVIICENNKNAVSGVDVRGGDPAVGNIEGIRPENKVDYCDAIVLTGGSTFGLDTIGGVEEYLEEKKVGEVMNVPGLIIPTVAGAVIYDLALGDYKVRPDKQMAKEACENAYKGLKYPDGNIGAGTGGTVGKIRTIKNGMKGGLGTSCLKKGDLYVGVIVAVNAVGNVVDPTTSEILAGVRDQKNKMFDAEQYVLENFAQEEVEKGNTTIGAIITNAKLSKARAQKLAMLSHDGLARVIRPIHTLADGDTMFATATGEVEASMMLLEVMTIRATEQAVMNAIKSANHAEGTVCHQELHRL